ncbi:hypothetical protein RSOLAG1IB_10783 [Rhizoctonia solani AG-1 IB]|uniref:Uncharacterized protein n=1 Tax=Thanatephorus cucumeris (strain AG1-IB / isolate 7/3/14) TaxID=1108050 RepID=A0A0B7G4S1_THACB|nr:hypothetical protein RSOLAG1IB_10783 [Rhizoctonia solani AG-1 IB]
MWHSLCRTLALSATVYRSQVTGRKVQIINVTNDDFRRMISKSSTRCETPNPKLAEIHLVTTEMHHPS